MSGGTGAGSPDSCFPEVLGSPSFAPLPSGRRLRQCWLPRPRKTHFFPLSSQRKQNGSAAREEPVPAGGPFAGCLWNGLGGAREGAVGGLAAADWAGQLSVPQEEVHFSTPPPHLQLKVKNLQTLEVALLASEGCVGVRVWAQGQDSWVPAHHCHQTAAQLSL